MQLSISNIAWGSELDYKVYELMKKYGYSGLEIAPTRIFMKQPYDKIDDARNWQKHLQDDYGFVISSMQSIWYGRQEMLFGTDEEREFLIDYTKKAIDFAVAIGCKNLVFGCPRNRIMSNMADSQIAVTFFRRLGNYAYERGTVIALEAVPHIYNTNFINDTTAALEFVRTVNSRGFLLNLDAGTIICNKEDPEKLIGQIKYVNHVHISEPSLKLIEQRDLHKKLKQLLIREDYTGFISIEMGKQEESTVLEDTMQYIAGVFKNDI